MPSNLAPVPVSESDTTGTTGTDPDNLAARCRSTHPPHPGRVPSVPVVPVASGIPSLLQSFVDVPTPRPSEAPPPTT